MTSSTFSGLGGGANHSLRDVGKAEPRAEVDRPIASQGTEIDMRSLFELPVTQNPHKCVAPLAANNLQSGLSSASSVASSTLRL